MRGSNLYCVALPVVVVPDGMLWKVEYDHNGQQVDECKTAAQVSYFVDYAYKVRFAERFASFVASHVEIMTLQAFSDLVGSLEKTSVYNSFFPEPVIWSVMRPDQIGHKP